MAKALQTVYPPGQEFIPDLRIACLRRPSVIVPRLANSIGQATPSGQRPGLMLDGFHRIHKSEIHAALQARLEYYPTALQLIISGNFQSHLAPGHRRATRMVLEPGADGRPGHRTHQPNIT